MVQTYNISDICGLINWQYFYYAWGMSDKPEVEREILRKDAEALLDEWETKYHSKAILLKLKANSDGDDILIGEDGKRFPMLRQQQAENSGDPHLCLADYIRPKKQGIADEVGVFCTTVDVEMEQYADDPYMRMLSLTLADRLAEATAEQLNTLMPGIRPAVGYPVMPDMSLNFILDELMEMNQIGITLTESGMMQPHSSVSGIIIQHPEARYFNIGQIGEDQLTDYSRRRGYTVDEMRRFIKI